MYTLNGIRLASDDFTATSGSTVVLAVGASVNDTVDIVSTGDGITFRSTSDASGDRFTFNNLGIGTDQTPDALNVRGNSSFVGVTTFNGDVTFQTTNSNNIVFDKSDNSLTFGNSVKSNFGDSKELQISHASNVSRIQSDNDILYFKGLGINFYKGNSSELFAKFVSDNQAELYFNGTKRFETTNTGSKVTGNLEVTGVLTYDDVTNVDSVGIITARQGIFIDDSITHIGDTNTKIRFPAVDTFTVETSGAERFRIASNGGVGIGTDDPAVPVHVYHATNNEVARFESGDATCYVTFGDNASNTSSNNRPLLGAKTDDLFFQTGGSEKLRINSDGRVLVGTTAARTVGGSVHRLLQVEGTDGRSGISITRNSNNASTPTLDFGKSRGNSVGSNVIVQEDDQLGVIQFCGSDGTDIGTEAAQIAGLVDGTPGSNDMPGRLVFKTTPDGSSTATERLRITSNGKINVGGDFSQSTRQLSVVSSVEQVATFEYSGTDADGSEVRFYHNSSSPADNDTLAFLQFSGKNSADEVTMYSGISASKR